MRRYIIIICIVACGLCLFLPMFFFLLGGADGAMRLSKGDPAAPPVLDAVSRLLFVAIYAATNKLTLKNKYAYWSVLAASVIVGSYMIYDLCFEWSSDKLGHTKYDWVGCTIVSMMLPLNVYLHRLLVDNGSSKNSEPFEPTEARNRI